MTFII